MMAVANSLRCAKRLTGTCRGPWWTKCKLRAVARPLNCGVRPPAWLLLARLTCWEIPADTRFAIILIQQREELSSEGLCVHPRQP